MLLIYVLCYLVIQGAVTLPYPFGNARQLDATATSSTVCPDPTLRRSLTDIIQSCLATMFACTWLAIHPNIPAPDEGFIRVNLVRRLKIVLVALIAPELIILWAMRQCFVARLLARRFANHNWTKTHGFFALMGGFRVRQNDGRDHPIALADLEEHLEAGRINITEKEIEDRSKSNVLSKGLVLLQTGWFMLQLLTRAIQHLPITELEIATLAFASLSFTIYLVWWNKPLDVQCSIVLTVPPRNTAVSVALAASQAPGEADQAEEVEIQTVPRSAADHVSREIGQASEEDAQASEGINLVAEGVNPASKITDPNSERANLISEGTAHAPGACPENPNAILIKFWQVPLHRAVAAAIRLWDMFAKATEGTRREILQLFEDLIARGLGDARLETYFADNQRVPTFYWGTDLTDDTYERFNHRRMRPLVALAGTVFGGIHCIAWRFGIPSEAERILWRVAACLTTTIPLPIVLAAAVTGHGGIFSSRQDSIQPIIIGAVVLYTIARLSLLVQAFALLRTLPEGANTEVQWISHMLHI